MYVGDSGRSCTCSGWSRIFREKQLVIKNFICKKSRLEAFPIHMCWSCEKGSRVGRAALTEPRSRCTTSSKRRTRELKSSGKALSFLGEERFLILIYQTVVKEKEKKKSITMDCIMAVNAVFLWWWWWWWLFYLLRLLDFFNS